ncbi:MAG TPA: histidine phosphatase family protein [Pseudonocardiaceae bacterium]|nr:histidine phosphatase family protein [Pseudonocardiaceae bacterium]
MTHTLILLRHAKSAWPDGIPDIQRPLAGRGHRDAPAVGRWLREQIARIDLVVCSPAARAVQTWELAAAQLEAIPLVRHDERLYGASAEELLTITQELPDTTSTVAMVGHNPGLEDFLELLTGTVEVLRTSAIVVMGTPATWAEAKARSWTVATMATPRGA